MSEKTTGSLDRILKSSTPADLDDYLSRHQEDMMSDERPFTQYMRGLLKKKGIRQQLLFRAADISEGYGYKLISQEAITRQRDVILRLCLAGGFSLVETNRALKLYGMTPLYAKIPRDAALIIAVNTDIREMDAVNRLLEKHGFPLLYAVNAAE